MRERVKILFVDDDPHILHGLRRMLYTMTKVWNIEFVNSAITALECFTREPIDIIVTDINMPIMGGQHLLEIVKNISPETVRVILSGQAEQGAVLAAAAYAHQFLAKPCDQQRLLKTLKMASAILDYVTDHEIKQIISVADKYPVLPSNLQQVMHELANEASSLGRIGEIVANDMWMSAKILQLLNTTFFLDAPNVASPVHAVSLLGVDVLRSLLLNHEVFYPVDEFHLAGDTTYSVKKMYRHSLTVATFAREIADIEGLPAQDAERCYIAGLLHDIGKLILVANMPATYAEAIRVACEQDLELADAERQVFGVSHAEIGAYILGLWAFDESIVSACFYHHHPSIQVGNDFTVTTAVHAANFLDYSMNPSPSNLQIRHIDFAYVERIGSMYDLGNWSRQLLCLTTGG